MSGRCDGVDPNTLARQGVNQQVADEIDMEALNNLLLSRLTEVDATMDETNDDDVNDDAAEWDEINAESKVAILESTALWCPAVEEGAKCGGVKGAPCPWNNIALTATLLGPDDESVAPGGHVFDTCYSCADANGNEEYQKHPAACLHGYNRYRGYRDCKDCHKNCIDQSQVVRKCKYYEECKVIGCYNETSTCKDCHNLDQNFIRSNTPVECQRCGLSRRGHVVANRGVCDRDCLGKCEGKIGEELCTNDACTQGPGRYLKFCGYNTITTDGGERKEVSYCSKLKAIENGDVFTWVRCDDCGKKRKIKGGVGSKQMCRNKGGKNGCGYGNGGHIDWEECSDGEEETC